MYGILVAITVRNWTFASSGRLAMYTIERATWSRSSVGSVAVEPSAWSVPVIIGPAMSVAAFPMSIWPQAMSYARPSRDVALVSPVIACLVAVYAAKRGRGTWA